MKPWLTTNPYGSKGINLRRGPIHWRSPPRQQEISPFQTACMVNCLPVNCPPQKHTSRVRRVVKLASLTPPPLLFCHTKKRKGNEWRRLTLQDPGSLPLAELQEEERHRRGEVVLAPPGDRRRRRPRGGGIGGGKLQGQRRTTR